MFFTNRDRFIDALKAAEKTTGTKLDVQLKKAVLSALSERDENADVCTDAGGNTEPDKDLRDTENVPLSESIDEYFAREVTPYVPDARIDTAKTDDKDVQVGIVGYEIDFNRYFYTYVPPSSRRDRIKPQGCRGRDSRAAQAGDGVMHIFTMPW